MKNIIKLLFLSLLFTYTNYSFALTKVYDFSDSTKYTVSNSLTVEIAEWIWRLIPQFEFLSNISNWSLNNVEDILVDWNYIYAAASRSDNIQVIDISNPANPINLANIVKSWLIDLDDPRAIAKSWNYLYVASYLSDAIEVINISNPSNPTHVSKITDSWTTYLNWAKWLTISWNYLYVTSYLDDALEIINISNPASPTHIWSLRNTSRLNWADSVTILWNYAYVTSYLNNSVQVIDISNPALPNFVWQIVNWGTTLLNWPREILIQWNYAYVVSDVSNSLEVINISNPSSPTHVTSITTWWTINIDWANALDIYYDNLFIASSNWDSYTIIDISDPTNLKQRNITEVWTMPAISWASSIKFALPYTIIWSNIDDNVSIINSYVDNNSPYIIPNNAVVYSWSIDQWEVQLWDLSNITFQLSNNDWATWYYFNWSSRVSTTAWNSQSNIAFDSNYNLQSFNNLSWWTWKLKWKAFLNSDWTFLVDIDNILVQYSSDWNNEIIDFEIVWWYTVTQWTFTRTTNNPQEWIYSIESWNHTNNSTSCFEVNRDIYTESNISFYKSVSSEASYDFLRFYIDWVQQNQWSWEVSWSQEKYNISNGNHTFEWCYSKDVSVSNWSDNTWVDYIEITEIPPTLETPILDFEVAWWYTVTTTVTTPWPDWLRVTTEQYEWLYSIESQNRTNNSTSCFERVQTVSSIDDWISFYKKVSSEPWYDFLIFYINWVEQSRWAWELAWAKEEYLLTPWDYTLKWCYLKDWSQASWQDRAWIDLVSVTQYPPIISEVTSVATPTNDNTPDYTFFSPIAWSISYSWSCTSSTNTWAVIWNNTITFDSLSDWTYTNCTIQVLASPKDSNVLNVKNFTIDTTRIDIIINYPIDLDTIPSSVFNIDVNYDDTESWVNTWSIILNLYKWNWSSYWSDIAQNYVNFSWATINATWALFPTSSLPEWQYKVKFSIEDTTWNIWITDSVFFVTGWDYTWPIVVFNHPYNWLLRPNTNFDLNISYSDPETWVNTWAIAWTLKKWDWVSTYWPDISGTYVNFTWGTITATWAIYPISKLWFWKYQMAYSIENNNAVTSTWTLEFYIDEPEFIISTWSLDIWILEPWIKKFSDNEFLITVKTVWAWFDLVLSKTANFLNWTIEIIDWDWSKWIWYEVYPYSDTINVIWTDTIIRSESWSINTNWEKNIYQYFIQMWALIDEEQAAWIYEWYIKYNIKLNY